VEALPFLGLAVVLGLKHAWDADHLAAVSTLLGRSTTVGQAAGWSAWWAAGHTLTAALLTIALFLLGHAAASALRGLEAFVAVMLVLLGLAAILAETAQAHGHAHDHGARRHAHRHLHLLGRIRSLRSRRLAEGHEHHAMLGIGLVHGLASNDELLLLLTAALGVTSLGALLAGVAAFSLGVVAGMVLFAAVLMGPALRWSRERVRRGIALGAGAASVGYGLWLLAAMAGWGAVPLPGL
jgi:high-affinity nickel permease